MGAMEGWAYPPTGAAAEKVSMATQMESRVGIPDVEEARRLLRPGAIHVAEQVASAVLGSHATLPILTSLPTDSVADYHVVRTLVTTVFTDGSITPSASPGHPITARAATNAIAVADYFDILVHWATCAIVALSYGDVTLDEGRRCGISMATRIFIKSEPHSAKKLLEERYRIVYSVSLIENVVERILFGFIGYAMKATWTEGEWGLGMGHSCSQIQSVNELIQRRGFRADSDQRGFDVNQDEPHFEAREVFTRELAARLQLSTMWVKMALFFIEIWQHKVILFSDGTVALLDCIWPSGRYTTSLGQTYMEKIAAAAAALALGRVPGNMAQGDDALYTDITTEYASLFSVLGLPLKQFNVGPIREFCGHTYSGHGCQATFLGVGKALARLCSKTPNNVVESLDGVLYALRHNDLHQDVISLLTQVGNFGEPDHGVEALLHRDRCDGSGQ